jgi:uncharacterized repeat protein (TIGR01451 family)
MPGIARAVGTTAGTPITNTASVTYTVGGTSVTSSSNTSTLLVAEILDVDVTLQSATVTVVPGATQQELVFRITNTGNGPEVLRLTGDSVLTGDDFDPTPSSPFIWFDTDGSGDLSAADTPYVPGSNDPSLDADAAITVIVVNDIPAGLATGNRGRSALRAAALTGTGAPGTVFAGQGTSGVDAVAGTTGGDGEATGEYVVSDVTLVATKSQAIADPFGGTTPVPGSTVTYQVIVTASGPGRATAATFEDAIPTWTAYVPGSLALNGGALSDAADADAGELVTAPAPRIRVRLGDLTAAAGPQTIVFRVTVN